MARHYLRLPLRDDVEGRAAAYWRHHRETSEANRRRHRGRRKTKNQSDEAIAAYEKALADARARAQTIANETRERQAAEAEKTRGRLEDALNVKLAEAEKSIAATKQAAMANVRGIAVDATKAIVERLIGSVPADAAVDAAVTDALKR